MRAQNAFHRRRNRTGLFAAIMLNALWRASADPPPPPGDHSKRTWQEIVDTANQPAVLWITFLGTYENGLQDRQTGTGFIVSAEGHFLTCSHVLPPNKPYKAYEAKVVVGSRDGPAYTVRDTDLKDRYEDADLVVFQLPKTPTPWHSIQAVNENGVRHMPVMGLGFPLEEDLTYANGEITSLRANKPKCWLTSAPLNRGMSGGPIFDESGAVVAVTASGHPDAQLISEIIPISIAVDALRHVASPSLTKQSKAVQQSAEQLAKAAVKVDQVQDALPTKQLNAEQQNKISDLLNKAAESQEAALSAYKKFVEISRDRPGRQSIAERAPVVEDLKDRAKEYQAIGNALARLVETTAPGDQ
jgi:S1-C subfamily serine protease